MGGKQNGSLFEGNHEEAEVEDSSTDVEDYIAAESSFLDRTTDTEESTDEEDTEDVLTVPEQSQDTEKAIDKEWLDALQLASADSQVHLLHIAYATEGMIKRAARRPEHLQNDATAKTNNVILSLTYGVGADGEGRNNV